MSQCLRSLVSIRAAIGVAPVLARAEFLVAAGVAPHPASGLVVGGNEAVPVTHAAIVGGLHLVPDDEALLGDAAGVDAHRIDPAADHEPVEPLPRPLDLAFEVAAAFRDPGRPQAAGGERREPRLLQLVHAALERQAA